MRILINDDPFIHPSPDQTWSGDGLWPAQWVCVPQASAPFVSAYRLAFELPQAATLRLHVSADERYHLYLDGERIGRGPERGAPSVWFYESYDVPMTAGKHCLVAQVWSFGDLAPYAQMHHQDGFILAAEGPATRLLSTGVASWEVKLLSGCEFYVTPTFATGPNVTIDGQAFPWGFESGLGEGWQPVKVLEPGYSCISPYDKHETRFLKPAMLPQMMLQPLTGGRVRASERLDSIETQSLPVHEQDALQVGAAWQALYQHGQALIVPAHTCYRVILDLENYACAYPKLVTSGGQGSLVRVSWAEALFLEPGYYKPKGNRNAIEGKYYLGLGDTFLPDGGSQRTFETLWWKAGRYLEVVVRTADTPLTLEAFSLTETHYPIEMESTFSADDPRLAATLPLLVRGIQMDAHETYMDCPFYEQMMYAGDTRLEILTTYVMTRDDHLPRKAIRLFDASRLASGITYSRYPTREFQVIPPFTLWWVAMVRDYALWRGDAAFLKRTLPGVHAALEGYGLNVKEDGLLHAPQGWNFMDWVPEWLRGIPPEGDLGVNGLMNWQYVLVLGLAAELETLAGRPEFAAVMQQRAAEMEANVTAAFWDEHRGLFAEDLSHQHFSEHTQCLALLTHRLSAEKKQRVAAGLLNDPDLARTTVYFAHYLFEAYREIGALDALFKRLGLWFDLVDQGFKTPIEQPEPSRSDCHAWGSHPLYHYYATLLGIRPSSLGFRSVRIEPKLGPLHTASGDLVHPLGSIHVELTQANGKIHGKICLPEGVTGEFVEGGRVVALHEGVQEV